MRLLTASRAFYVEFFLAHPASLLERVEAVPSRTGEVEERLISADKLLTWAEAQTVETRDHPEPLPGWNFSQSLTTAAFSPMLLPPDKTRPIPLSDFLLKQIPVGKVAFLWMSRHPRGAAWVSCCMNRLGDVGSGRSFVSRAPR